MIEGISSEFLDTKIKELLKQIVKSWENQYNNVNSNIPTNNVVLPSQILNDDDEKNENLHKISNRNQSIRVQIKRNFEILHHGK